MTTFAAVERHVTGHMADEELTLYPLIAEQLGGPAATARASHRVESRCPFRARCGSGQRPLMKSG